MDPITNLREQRELAEALIETIESIEFDGDPTLAQCAAIQMCGADLAERVQALDTWRKRGGFDPYLSLQTAPFSRNELIEGCETTSDREVVERVIANARATRQRAVGEGAIASA